MTQHLGSARESRQWVGAVDCSKPDVPELCSAGFLAARTQARRSGDVEPDGQRHAGTKKGRGGSAGEGRLMRGGAAGRLYWASIFVGLEEEEDAGGEGRSGQCY